MGTKEVFGEEAGDGQGGIDPMSNLQEIGRNKSPKIILADKDGRNLSLHWQQ